MRVRDHVALSSAASTLLVPWLRWATAIPWAASILIDVDHYLFASVHERTINPRTAVRYFNQAQPAQHAGTRVLHHPLVLVLGLLLFGRWRWARLIVLGMAFHVGLDLFHGVRMRQVRAAALLRDGNTCQRCGARGSQIVAHQFRQPRLLPAYRPDDLICLCPACHELAHAQGSGAPITTEMPAAAATASASPAQRGDG